METSYGKDHHEFPVYIQDKASSDVTVGWI